MSSCKVRQLSEDGAGDVKSRLSSVDILKGAAIIGVVLAHLVLIQNQSEFGEASFEIGELFYAALPMFFVLSGYFYRPCTVKENLRARVFPLVLGLIVGTIVLTVTMYLYLLPLGYDLSDSDLWGDIAQIIIGKGSFQDMYDSNYTGGDILDVFEVTLPVYFIQVMVVGYLIFLPIAEFVMKDWRRAVITIFFLLSITCAYMELFHIQLPFYAQLGPLVASFYITGAYLGKYKVAEYFERGFREKKYWIVFIIFLVAALLCIQFFPTRMALIYSKFGDYGGYSVFSFYALTMACGIVLMYVAALVSHVKWVTSILTLVGRETLYIFFLHIFVAKMLVAPFVTLDVQSWIPIDSLPQSILLAIITIALIVIAVMLFRRIKSKNKPIVSYQK